MRFSDFCPEKGEYTRPKMLVEAFFFAKGLASMKLLKDADSEVH